MAKFKNLIFIVLLVALFIEVLIVFPKKLEKESESEPAPTAVESTQKPELNPDGTEKAKSAVAEQKMKGVHLVESQKGNRDWELFSEAAEGSQESGNWKVLKVRVLFYNKEKIEFTVTGDEGSIDYKTKDMTIRGNVTTKSTNGYVFNTPSITYSATTRQIVSPETVNMTGPKDSSGQGMALTGGRMTSFIDTTKMVIDKGVRAKKPMQDGKTFAVAADAAEFNGRNNQAKFRGTVQMSYDQMKLEGPEATFLYQKGMDLLTSVSINGGVKVSDVDKFATSESVNLDLLANKYTFKGRPKVVQNADELSGEEIIFLDGGKRVRVEKVRAKMEKKSE
jgi:Organic solvent tolerance protein OstA